MVLRGLVGKKEQEVLAVRPAERLHFFQQRSGECLAVSGKEDTHVVARVVVAQEDAALQEQCFLAPRRGECVVHVLQGGGLRLSDARHYHQVVVHQLAVRPQRHHVAATLGGKSALHCVAAPLRFIAHAHRHEGTGVEVFVPVAVGASLRQCGLQLGQCVVAHDADSTLVF